MFNLFRCTFKYWWRSELTYRHDEISTYHRDHIINIPRSLASSTRMISFSSDLGDLFITDQTVLSKVVHASLWKTITMLVSGRYLGYFLFLQPSSLMSFNDRFREIMSLAIRLNWFNLNSSCCLASFSGAMCTAAPISPGLPLLSLMTFAGRHRCNFNCGYCFLLLNSCFNGCASLMSDLGWSWGDSSDCSTCCCCCCCCCCLLSVQPHPDPPMQSE